MNETRRGAPGQAPLANTDATKRNVLHDSTAEHGQSVAVGGVAQQLGAPPENYPCSCTIGDEAVAAFDNHRPGDDLQALRETIHAAREICAGCKDWEDFLETQPPRLDVAAFDAVAQRVVEAHRAQAAVDAAIEAKEAKDPRWILAGELLSRDQLANLPAPSPVIDGTLFRDTLAVLVGAPGAGKSFVALDWALSVATGTAWHGRPVTPGPVLYIAAEGVAGLSPRIGAWEEARDCQTGNNLRVLPRAHNLLDAVDTHVLAGVCADLRPSLIIIDTLSRSIVGADENSAQEMTRAIQHADRLRTASGAAVVLVHHVAKGTGTPRGSGALVGAADTVYAVTPDSRGVIKVQRTKSKDTELDDVMLLRLTPSGQSVALEAVTASGRLGTAAGATGELLMFIRDTFGTTGATKTELKTTCGLPSSTFYRALNALVSDGLLVTAGSSSRPIYHLAEN